MQNGTLAERRKKTARSDETAFKLFPPLIWSVRMSSFLRKISSHRDGVCPHSDLCASFKKMHLLMEI